ncbi:MAG TPA: cell division protein FtsA [Chitinophagaceae bacterium]|nr:MAG: cell division protein FtsA [Bacteroidetes bacterium OLB11]HMN31754.1 cell division protein FtsA [Chitinophagaceae bacterium]
MQQKNPIIVGLDIGTTKIVAIAGRKNEYGKLEILGFGRADSNGVSHGMVLNIEETTQSILVAIERCLESNPNLTIKDVYVGIAGQHISSLQSKGERVINNSEEEIRKEDIDALIKDQYNTFVPNNDQIIDVIPQDFTVDMHTGFSLAQVIGMTGARIGANFHIITGNKSAIKNINRCVKKAELNTKDLVLQPLASAAAVMCSDDLESGVAIVDIGGGTTDLAIFHEGMLKHTAVIPIAGVNITNDIRQGLGVLKAHAETMKVKYGMALSSEAQSNSFIAIPGFKGQPSREISIKNLSKIIQSRMDEILDYVVYHIKQLGLEEKLYGGIILTGGGSQLQHLKQLTEFKTGLAARIGLPNEHLNGAYDVDLANPMYSTCIGLILKGYDEFENNQISFTSNNLDATLSKNTQLETTSNLDQELTPSEMIEISFGSQNKETDFNSEEPHPTQDGLEDGVIEEPYPAQGESEEKPNKRRNLINDIFNSVKGKILNLFENVEDEKL